MPAVKIIRRNSRPVVRRVLNAGSGPKPSRLHPIFASGSWEHVRLDANPAAEPDLLGSVADMTTLIAGETFDAVWSSHNLEHLHDHEVGPALKEIRRILRPGGFALITCPSLEAICRSMSRLDVEAPVYVSPAGPISALDMIFGHQASVRAGNEYMAHRTGFTAERLASDLMEAGFEAVRVAAGSGLDLWAVAVKNKAYQAGIEDELRRSSLGQVLFGGAVLLL